MKVRPLVLAVLDGWGIAPPSSGNAIYKAVLPHYKNLLASFPHGILLASGSAVGLPEQEQGNSEVGHLNLGAGRIVYQDLERINLSIKNGDFLKNGIFLKTIDFVKNQNSQLHLMGLVGPSGVHSSLNHLYALLWLLKEQNLKDKVFLHLWTDGRDSPTNVSVKILEELENRLNELDIGQIATICGRWYSMDRDNRWERTQACYEAMVQGKGLTANSSLEAVEAAYKRGETDEFIKPTVIVKNNTPQATISDNDAVISFNFRTDRTRQIIKALVLPNAEMVRQKVVKNLMVVTMTEYEKGLPVEVAFKPIEVPLPLAEVLSTQGLRQLHISETEKYPHVTYFFNGGRELSFPDEDVLEIPSPKVATYDLKPEMSAYQLTDEVLKRLSLRLYDFILINFANPDMVGHSGNLEATIRACEVVDECIGKIYQAVKTLGGGLIVTSDHGNAEVKINPEIGQISTSHTTNPVPVILACPPFLSQPQDLGMGKLADVAPTVLRLMGLPIPPVMTGKVLI